MHCNTNKKLTDVRDDQHQNQPHKSKMLT